MSAPDLAQPGLSTSPLHDRHVALGAKLAEFGGWQMPLEYPTGVMKEHHAVRSAVGVFDVSHLGTATVEGPGAAALVDATLTNDLAKIGPGRAQYTLCCDENSGGVVDDLIVYLHDAERVFVMPNAANASEVLRRLAAAAPDGVVVHDRHTEQAVLAVQGPRCEEVLTDLGLPVGHEYMSFVEASPALLGGGSVTVCRTGYTGEQGYELVCDHEHAVTLWDALLEAGEPHGLLPCGLGARDTLRTEMGYPLHGQDLSLQVTPNQARLGWAVGWSKPAFWGRERLLVEREQGPRRVLRGLRAVGRGIPRPGMSVTRPGGDESGPGAASAPAREILGEITSGTFSPTLRSGIGLALLSSQVREGEEVSVDVRGRSEIFVVTRPPFVDPTVRGS